MIYKSVTKIVALPRWIKKIIAIMLDVILCFISCWAAFSLRLEIIQPINLPYIIASSTSIIIFVPIFIKLGMYRAIFRYSGVLAALSLVQGLFLHGIIYAFIFTIVIINDVPRSVGVIHPIVFSTTVSVSRLIVRYLLSLFVFDNPKKTKKKLVLIYGAGSSGRQLASALMQGGEFKPVAFIDDDPRLWAVHINDLPVYSASDINKLLKSGLVITDILLAIPSASRSRKKEILANLSELPLHVRVLPSLSRFVEKPIDVDSIKIVEIEDVLGRDAVQANSDIMRQSISGRCILVTGAGGSIGSELCRQIVTYDPKKLIIFDLSEYSLYKIEHELSNNSINCEIIPVLGSVLDKFHLSQIFRQYKIDIVYHAAAYKHVPLIEKNPCLGVYNNVFGTLNTIDVACEEGVGTYVFISTDKAVRPTSIMGCSKRLAEMTIQAKHQYLLSYNPNKTKMTMVRFGNVLGSSGSVVPLFREQIKNGGPVTVTHPDIIRYFMTIPEAAQLVIQAGVIGHGGDVMLLDMGEPVKIIDLAKRMIHLSGFTHQSEDNPDGEIKISFTGLRPGEKLYEELLIEENAIRTIHPRIMRANERYLKWEELHPILNDIERACEIQDILSLKSMLKKAVPEYSSQ
jgi:FlaA1/EpsC-like NDP-sugar epimerase